MYDASENNNLKCNKQELNINYVSTKNNVG